MLTRLEMRSCDALVQWEAGCSPGAAVNKPGAFVLAVEFSLDATTMSRNADTICLLSVLVRGADGSGIRKMTLRLHGTRLALLLA